jgi:hypothetical protein
MPLTNNGRILLQNRMETLATHFQLGIVDGAGSSFWSSPQEITFLDANALAGLRLGSPIQTNIAVCNDNNDPACYYTLVTGLRLVNSNATTVYMQQEFSTLYTFANDGVFTLSQLVVSFA